MRARPPGDDRPLGRVIIREIVLWDVRMNSGFQIAIIFLFQRVRVIFCMTQKENLPAFIGLIA